MIAMVIEENPLLLMPALIIIMFAAQKRLSPLLGQSYREKDYSPAFHSMVNRVVSKIYHKRGRRRPILASNALQSLNQQQKQENGALSHFLFSTIRKNSPKPPKFFVTPRNSNGKLFKRPQEKSSEVVPSLEKRFTRTQYNQRNLKCQTEPHSSYSYKLYQKISEYNQCLVTKTFKFQQKNKLATQIEPQLAQTQRQFNLSSPMGRKMHNLTMRDKKFSVKTMKQAPRSTSLPIAFKNELKPWQTKQADQFAF